MRQSVPAQPTHHRVRENLFEMLLPGTLLTKMLVRRNFVVQDLGDTRELEANLRLWLPNFTFHLLQDIHEASTVGKRNGRPPQPCKWRL